MLLTVAILKLIVVNWLWMIASGMVVVQINYDALYLPASSSAFLRNLSIGITSTKFCIWSCTNDQRCQTAIYFYESQMCSMFSELCSAGVIQSAPQTRAHVICYQQETGIGLLILSSRSDISFE